MSFEFFDIYKRSTEYHTNIQSNIQNQGDVEFGKCTQCTILNLNIQNPYILYLRVLTINIYGQFTMLYGSLGMNWKLEYICFIYFFCKVIQKPFLLLFERCNKLFEKYFNFHGGIYIKLGFKCELMKLIFNVNYTGLCLILAIMLFKLCIFVYSIVIEFFFFQ